MQHHKNKAAHNTLSHLMSSFLKFMSVGEVPLNMTKRLSMMLLLRCRQRPQLQLSLSGVTQLNLEHISPRSSPAAG
jgi:hypothetical protein